MRFYHKLGIGLIPETNQIEQIYNLINQIFKKYNLSFATQEGVSIPHLTLFQGKYRDKGEVINKLKSLDLKLSETYLIQGLSIWARKIIFLDLIKTDSLQQTHNNIYQALFPLCEGKSADPQKFEGITPGQQKSFDETGYPFSLEEYLPHFTLAHIRELQNKLEETESELNKLLKKSRLEQITFDKLVVYRVGLLGSCINFAYEQKL